MSNEIINPRLVYTTEILKCRSVTHPLPNKAVARANPGVEFDSAVSLLLVSNSFYHEGTPDRPYDTAEMDEETNQVYNSMFFEILMPGSQFTYSSVSDMDLECRNLRSCTLFIPSHGELYFNYASASVNPFYIDIASDDIYLKSRADGTVRRHTETSKGGRLLWNFRNSEILRVSGRTADLSSVVITPSLVAA